MHHWQSRDSQRAQALRERAIAAYDAWGVVRKVNALRTHVAAADGAR